MGFSLLCCQHLPTTPGVETQSLSNEWRNDWLLGLLAARRGPCLLLGVLFSLFLELVWLSYMVLERASFLKMTGVLPTGSSYNLNAPFVSLHLQYVCSSAPSPQACVLLFYQFIFSKNEFQPCGSSLAAVVLQILAFIFINSKDVLTTRFVVPPPISLKTNSFSTL